MFHLISTLVFLVQISPSQTPIPTDQNWTVLRNQIVPSKDELGWRGLDWNVTLWEAIQKSKTSGKPVLLYAMNGHPLACT